MVGANRRFFVVILALLAAIFPVSAAFADCQTVGPAKVGDCPAPQPASQSGSGSGTAKPADARGAAAKFYSLVNGERANRGLDRLVRNSQLERIALDHARRMAKSGKVYHNDSLFSASTIASLGNPTSVGENVGRGDSVDGLHSAFMRSSEHRANVLDRSYGESGFAVVYGSGQLWVVEAFMSAVPHHIARTWAGGGAEDIVRSRVLRFTGPALGAFRWSAPATEMQEGFYVQSAQAPSQPKSLRSVAKSVPGGAAGLAFALAFAVVLGAAFPRGRSGEDYL